MRLKKRLRMEKLQLETADGFAHLLHCSWRLLLTYEARVNPADVPRYRFCKL